MICVYVFRHWMCTLFLVRRTSIIRTGLNYCLLQPQGRSTTNLVCILGCPDTFINEIQIIEQSQSEYIHADSNTLWLLIWTNRTTRNPFSHWNPALRFPFRQPPRSQRPC